MLPDKQFCVVVTSFLTLIAFIFVMRFLPDFLTWTGWRLCNECTVQGWIGATSGWAGAIAAGAAILPLFKQLREQRLQTAFTVGDALPTIDAVEHLRTSSELVVRIVNWNRRGIVVRDIAAGRGALLFPKNMEIDGESVAFSMTDFGIDPFAIRGWEDRSKGPHRAEIRLIAYEIQNLDMLASWEQLPKLTAKVQILGNAHEIVNLSADTRPITSQ